MMIQPCRRSLPCASLDRSSLLLPRGGALSDPEQCPLSTHCGHWRSVLNRIHAVGVGAGCEVTAVTLRSDLVVKSRAEHAEETIGGNSMARIAGICVLFALSLTSCNSSPTDEASDARRAANRLSGDDKATASNNAQCALFTVEEIGSYGQPVEAGENAAGGTGCQWLAKDGEGSAMLQVVPAEYHSAPSRSPGYKALSDVGEKGFVTEDYGGWKAAAIKGDKSIHVTLSTGGGEAQTVAFLREALKRTRT
jgi:hypothetical protein